MTNAFIITEEENWFVATDFATGIASQGKTSDEARVNLREALDLYYESSPRDMSFKIRSAELIEV